MVKLIYEHHSSDGYTYSSTDAIPFEYCSKDDFVLEILNRIDIALKRAVEEKMGYAMVNVLGMELAVGSEINPEDIERSTYTIEDWCEENKRTP